MRCLMTFSYDGTDYNGYQKQKEGRTIQGILESVLTTINGNKLVSVSASGRTDAHVHAIGQTAHFDIDTKIEPNNLKRALNSMLPNDIYIKNVEIVKDDFHARYDVKSKEYIYILNIGEYNPIERNYIYQYNKELNVNAMKEAIKNLIGTHDFTSFTKADDERESYVRTIKEADISIDKDYITFRFLGTGFLRYMVRNMVGFLIEVGEGKRTSECVIELLELKDRTKAGKTAPPEGLYLKEVFY